MQNGDPFSGRPLQYDGIQALRFFAALAVVFCHAAFYTTERLHVGRLLPWGGSGVDVFFVISGFVMLLSSQRLVGVPGGWKDFLVQRLIRIAPLYWIATTAKLTVLLAAGALVYHAVVDWPSIARSYLFLPSRNVDGEIAPLLGVGWTLIYEMFFYAIFTLALALRANRFAFVGTVLALCSLGYLARPASFSPWLVYLDPLVLEFFYGMVIAGVMLRKFALPSPLAVVLAGAGAVLLVGQPDWGWGWRAITAGLPAAMIVLGVVALEPRLHGRVPRPLMFAGAASYSLYLFHPLSIPAVPVLLGRVGLQNATLSVLLGVTMALAAAAVVYVVIELPITRWLRRLSVFTAHTHRPVIEPVQSAPIGDSAGNRAPAGITP